MNSDRSALCAYVLAFATLFASASAEAIIIDDFSTDQGPITLSQSVAGDGILGGVRQALTASTSGRPTFEATGGVGMVQAGVGTSSQLSYLYSGGSDGFDFSLGGIDLTDGGISDRFLIELDSVIGEIRFFTISYSGTSNFDNLGGLDTSPESPYVVATDAGVLEILFSSLFVRGAGADLSNISQVFVGSRLDFGESYVVTRLATGNASGVVFGPIPEPSSLLLVSTGLMIVSASSRRRLALRHHAD